MMRAPFRIRFRLHEAEAKVSEQTTNVDLHSQSNILFVRVICTSNG